MKETVAMVLLAGLLAGVTSCSSGDTKSAGEALDEKGTLDVLKEASDDEYDPPADGKLTEQQIAMYLKVKEREVEFAKVAAERLKEDTDEADQADKEGSSATSFLKGVQALKNFGAFLTADVRAAQELGYNTAEYQWVKQQVLVSQMTVTAAEMQERMAKQSATADESDGFTKGEVEAARYNVKLLAPHKEQLNSLDTELGKWRTLARE